VVFGDGRSNGAISGSNKSKMAAMADAAIFENFQMVISPQPVIQQRVRPIYFAFGDVTVDA